jgi:hypothetical protein
MKPDRNARGLPRDAVAGQDASNANEAISRHKLELRSVASRRYLKSYNPWGREQA